MDSLIVAISALALFVIAAVCSVAVFAEIFDDSLVQCLSLSAIAIWCVLRISGELSGVAVVGGWGVVLHVALAVYAVATAIKVRRRLTAKTWRLSQHRRATDGS